MEMAGPKPGFSGPDAPTAEGIGACVHCGFCLPVCPTFRETANEASSPRGRIYLMRAISEGRLALSEGFGREMYDCLACRACETACPAGVRFGDLVERSRAQVEKTIPRPFAVRLLRRLTLQGLLPHPGRLAWIALGARLYRRLGIGPWLRRSGLLDRYPGLQAAEALVLPMGETAGPGARSGLHPRKGEGDREVAFFRGCVMEAVFGATNRRTVDLLCDNGCDVTVPDGQTCCGALHLHSGMREEGRELARRNVRAYRGTKGEAIVVNAAGCAATLKEYGDLLGADDELAGEAKAFSGKVRDISEYLASLPVRKPFPPLRARAVYQDACHLAHAQGIREAPRSLLREVPGLEILPFAESDSCCGSAGIYNITHPESSRRVLERKLDFIAEADPDLIISGNPGCFLQLGAGVQGRGLKARVLHTVDALSGVQGRRGPS